MKIYFLIFSALAFLAPERAAQAAISPLSAGVAGKYLSAQVAALRGHPGDAARFIERVWRQDDQNKDVLRQLIVLKITNGDIRPAFALGRKLIQLQQHEPLAVLLLGLEAMEKGDYSAAKNYFEGFEKSRHQDLGRWLSVSMLNVWTSQALGKTDKALLALERLDQLHPRLGSLMSFQKALLCDLSARPSLARSFYKKAMSSYTHLFGRLDRVGDAYGRFLERHGDKGQVERIYKNFIKAGGVDKVIGTAGLARLARGEKPRALVSEVNEGAAEVLYYYSMLAFLSHRLDEAALYTRLALFMRRPFDEAHLRLADIFEKQNDFHEAIRLYRRVAPRSDFALFAGVQIAFAYEESGRKDLAESQLFALARRYRTESMPLAALGEIFRARRDYVKSANIFSKAIERAGKSVASKNVANKNIDWRLYFSRGMALERSQQWRRAEKDLRHALALSKDDPNVLNYLGYSWIDRGYELDRALNMIKRAVRKAPNRGDIVDSLGWAHYRLGRFERAVHYLERAVQLNPGEAVINDHLGDALWQVGRKVEARYQWRRVLELKPLTDIDLEGVKRKLEEGLVRPSSAEMRF